jgi:hypothetical protein
MTFSAISARLITDLILGRGNSYSKIYDPTRIPTVYQLVKKARHYGMKFFGGAAKNFFRKK